MWGFVVFMPHYVYIIFSKSADIFYKGESADPDNRVITHNSGESVYTKGKGPWELVYLEQFENRTEALKREKVIKRLNRRSLEKLIASPLNLIGK